MAKLIIKKIKQFNKVVKVDGDKKFKYKSFLFGSQSFGKCEIKNLLDLEIF